MKAPLKTLSGISVLCAQQAGAGIIVVNPGDVTLALNQGSGASYDWDIDNNGTTDFRLDVATGVFESTVNLHWGENSGTNNGVAMQGTSVHAIPSGGYIGANLPSSLTFGSFLAGSTAHLIKTTHSLPFSQDTHIYVVPYAGSFSSNAKQNFNFYLGFRFDIDGADHYAWGQFEIATKNYFGEDSAALVRLLQWGYNDTAGESINAGQIPEPAALATGLGALALGAAGLRRWRKRTTKSRV